MTSRDITEFAPHRDGRNLDTEAIQAGIDAVHQLGGGTLRLVGGEYLTGGLILRSGVTLELDEDATLIASPRYDDFRNAEGATVVEGAHHAMILASQAHDIAIRGRGRILGNADAYFSADADADGYRQPFALRPRLILFEGCERVSIAGVRIHNAPIWTIHLVACVDVSVDRVVIDNDLTMANTDAIDIDGCRRVRISDCTLSSADDGVCIKTTNRPAALSGPAEQIVVTGCFIRSTSCAIKIGTETVEDVSSVIVSGCVIEANRGVGLTGRDGGTLRHILISDIVFDCRLAPAAYWGKGDPIFLSAGPRVDGGPLSTIEHVRFSNLSGQADGAINLHAVGGALVSDVSLDGIRIVQRRSTSPLQGTYDIRPVPTSETGHGAAPGGGLTGVEAYPGGLPGLFAKGIRGLSVRDLVVSRPSPLPADWNVDTIVESA